MVLPDITINCVGENPSKEYPDELMWLVPHKNLLFIVDYNNGTN